MTGTEDRSVPTLEEFDISPNIGFIIENPLGQLPEYYQPWEELCRDLPDLLRQHELRDKISKMPVLDWKQLKSKRELLLGHVLVSSLTGGYVWQEGEEGTPKVLPKCLAEPLHGLSDSLGLPAAVLYATLVFANLRPKDVTREMNIENMETIVNLTNGSVPAFEWFYKVAGQVELCGLTGVKGILSAQNSVKTDDVTGMIASLRQVKESLEEVKKAMRRFHEGTEASDFYCNMRPFVRGWSDLPEGITFEGAPSPTGKIAAVSAAHSPMMQTFDAAFGTAFTAERAEYVKSFRYFMLPQHRNFVEAVRLGPSISEYVKEKNDSIMNQLYEDCVKYLTDIRTYHVGLVTKYALIPTHKYDKDSPSAKEGAAQLMSMLKSVRDECKLHHEGA